MKRSCQRGWDNYGGSQKNTKKFQDLKTANCRCGQSLELADAPLAALTVITRRPERNRLERLFGEGIPIEDLRERVQRGGLKLDLGKIKFQL
jgi:hypothetical protein